ncbi:MAG: Crp/Fnr family transcriptional regulator [Porticoccaceae bacterium]
MTAPTASEHNLLLNALPDDARQRLLPYLELVYVPRGKTIHEAGEKLRYAYFPIDAIVALLNTTEVGVSTEISMVGNEGMVGVSIFTGGHATLSRAVVQQGGNMYRLLSKRLTDEFDRHGDLLALLLRYTWTLMIQVGQTAMCNRYHTIDQQLCRLVLQSLDRLRGDELMITQEHIAAMLGVRRESITEAVGRMKQLGLIQCHRGKVKVLNRPGIEARCCECYAVITTECDHVLRESRQVGYPVPGVGVHLCSGGLEVKYPHTYARR